MNFTHYPCWLGARHRLSPFGSSIGRRAPSSSASARKRLSLASVSPYRETFDASELHCCAVSRCWIASLHRPSRSQASASSRCQVKRSSGDATKSAGYLLRRLCHASRRAARLRIPAKLDSDSEGRWTLFPMEGGHQVRRKLIRLRSRRWSSGLFYQTESSVVNMIILVRRERPGEVVTERRRSRSGVTTGRGQPLPPLGSRFRP